MLIEEDNYLAHYGIIRRSGRYPWGSGGNVEQRSKSFLGYVDDMKRQGLSETDIARGVGMTTTELRAARSLARNASKQADIAMAQRLKDKGMSNVAIGERMGIGESQVRNLLAPGAQDKADILMTTSKMLKDQVDEKGLIDIGSGVEAHMNVSSTKLSTAVAMLKEEGYEVHNLKIQQVGTGHFTEMKVLAPPGTTWSDAMRNRDKIQSIEPYSQDGGRSYVRIQPPLPIKADRVAIRYAEQGGADADGVIYVRPGVEDVSIGNSRYAQVRVAVEGGKYIKGMAVYKNDLPDGVDLMFNTNKSDTGNKMDALKDMKKDPDNPFGSTIKRQILDSKGNPKSVMNLIYEEGDWDNWSRNLASQFLSKQSTDLARTQLDMTYEKRRHDLDEIKSLTNPTVRKKLLEAYADGTDSAAVHLKAAAMPGQRTHVILPVNSIKSNEVYAPNYKNGDRVALVRYPHGGTFEIPDLVVNNKNPNARKLLGNANDAIGINSKVAERLSGADFDGDTVLVIPNNSGRVKSTPPLDGLKNFDPQRSYKLPDDAPKISNRTKQLEMGKVSNLITDMTIKGATPNEIARAVRHSMVVIDAEKHHLDYKRSAQDNGIAALKEKYQGGKNRGATTLISRASSEKRVAERKLRPAAKGGGVDKETGQLVYEKTGRTYTTKDGATKQRITKTTKLADTNDARTLSSGTKMESLYANHSNRLKGLANEARREAVNTKSIPYSPTAKKTYAKEVAELDAALNVALRNRPRERQAQVIANAQVAAKRRDQPDLDDDSLKKIKAQALADARTRVGANKTLVTPTPRQWEAIQAGAISNNKLESILSNADLDAVKALAMPRQPTVMTSTKQKRAQAMLNSGYTQAEVAEALGVPLSTLKSSMSRKE